MFVLSPSMSLPIPTVGQEAGPQYGFDINSSLYLIDSHDHSPGKGVQITPNGLNINSNLDMIGNILTNAASVNFESQSGTAGLNSIYEKGVDLYFVDGNGNDVRITQSGGVAGTPGSIANLVPPASASYVSGSSTFVWQSNTNIAANMDMGAALLRNLSPNSTFALTLQPPAALSSNYTITLPVLPVSSSFLTIDPSGNMASSPSLTGGITTSMIGDLQVTNAKIANTTITAAKIANATITTAQIASATITPSNMAVVASGTTLDVATFTTTSTSFVSVGTLSTAATPPVGRPVFIYATPLSPGVADPYLRLVTNGSTNFHAAYFQVCRTSDNKVVGSSYFGFNGDGTAIQIRESQSTLNCVDISDGTDSYYVQVKNIFSVADTVEISQLRLTAIVL